MTNIGERIKTRRLELHWTQDDLGKKARLSKGFLSDLENGKRGVGAESLLGIAQALGLSVDFLIKGDPNEHKYTAIYLPGSLSLFAEEEGISFKQTLMLLEMQRLIIRYLRKGALDTADWRKFYESVKDFLKE